MKLNYFVKLQQKPMTRHISNRIDLHSQDWRILCMKCRLHWTRLWREVSNSIDEKPLLVWTSQQPGIRNTTATQINVHRPKLICKTLLPILVMFLSCISQTAMEECVQWKSGMEVNRTMGECNGSRSVQYLEEMKCEWNGSTCSWPLWASIY